MNKFLYTILFTLGLLTLAPALASAQVGTDQTAAVGTAVKTSVTATTPAGSATVQMSATAMTAAKARAHSELQRRVDSLNAVNTRIQGLQEVTATFKQSLQNAVQTQISAFQALDAKIQADTDAATLKTDVQSITQSYRVYALVLPQIRIAAAADRAIAIVAMMQTLGTKLNARIQAAGTAGANVTALQTALNDLATKISDANTQAQASVTTTASLAPDNGDTTKMASNTAALKQGRTSLTTVGTDLKAARADIATIIKGLKAIGPINTGATASSTTSVH
jgi:chromosome segregation ATPase